MSHRIFVAIKASQEVEDEFLRWKENFQKLPVRWIEPRNLHITLLPPWYEDDIDSTKEKLKTITGHVKPFDFSFKKISYGPSMYKPRLVWAEAGICTQMLVLKDKIEQAFGIPSDIRTTRIHITLARFRPEDFSRFATKNLDEKIHWKQEVSSIVLFESNLLPEGAEYNILEEVVF